jgi:hypothetical protein
LPALLCLAVDFMLQRRQGEDQSKKDAPSAGSRGTQCRQHEHEHTDGENRSGGNAPCSKIQSIGAFLVTRGGLARNAGRGHERQSGCVLDTIGFRKFGHHTQGTQVTKSDLPVILLGKTLDPAGPFSRRNVWPASSQTLGVDAAQSSFLERLPNSGLKVRY